jgi:hypothetical protein
MSTPPAGEIIVLVVPPATPFAKSPSGDAVVLYMPDPKPSLMGGDPLQLWLLAPFQIGLGVSLAAAAMIFAPFQTQTLQKPSS